jgi:hypothetical protein
MRVVLSQNRHVLVHLNRHGDKQETLLHMLKKVLHMYDVQLPAAVVLSNRNTALFGSVSQHHCARLLYMLAH